MIASVLFGAQQPIYITKHAQNLHDEQYKAHALCFYYQTHLPKQLGLFKQLLDCYIPKELALTVLQYVPEMASGAMHLIRSVDDRAPTSLQPVRLVKTRLGIVPTRFYVSDDCVDFDGNFDPSQSNKVEPMVGEADAAEQSKQQAVSPVLHYKTRLHELTKLSYDKYLESTDNVTSYWQERESERLRFMSDARRVSKETALLSKLTCLSQYAPWLLCVISLAPTYIIKKTLKQLADKKVWQDQQAVESWQLYRKLLAKYLARFTIFNTYLTETVAGLSKAHAYAIINNMAQYCEYYKFSNPYSHNKKSWPSVTRFVSLPDLTANYILFDLTYRCLLDACSDVVQKCDKRLQAQLSNYEYEDLKRVISNTIKIGVPMYLSLKGIRRQT